MSSFGQSHRELVQDTNAGNVAALPTQAVKQSATFQGQKEVSRDERSLANALVEVADTAARPYVQEQQRQAERDAYDAAGKEEGRQAADAAADVWHNKLFGPNASLRGAQERIAEDNARNLYLKAQDMLENGGADSWDDETWEEWKNEQIEDEVNKYDSEDMRNHVNTSMGKDFQKLERDRGYLHQQYLQAENRNALAGSLGNLTKTYNTERASTNPNRSEADAPERFGQLEELKANSGVTDKVFAEAVAQEAMNEYAKGNDDFGKYAEENGYFDDLDYEVQEHLNAAQRIHELKHDEEAHAMSQEIFGPRGHIARGNVSGAMEAYDAFVAQYPEAIPAGGRNSVKEQVEQQAWANAERARVEQQRRAIGKEGARTGNWQPVAQYDQFGRITGYSELSQHERIQYTREYAAEESEARFHREQELADPNYERQPMTSEQRQAQYQKDSKIMGQIMQNAGVVLPEVTAMTTGLMGNINHNLSDMTPVQAQQLKSDLDSINEMQHGNFAVTQMMMETLGEDYGKMEYVRNRLAAGDTAQQISRNLTEGMHQAPAPNALSAGIPGGGTGTTAYSATKSERKEMLATTLEGLNEGGFLFWGKLNDTNDTEMMLDQYFNESLQKQGSTSPSARKIAMGDARARVVREGAIITGMNGKKEMIVGAGQINSQLEEAGYEGGLDEYLKELGQNDVYMDRLRAASGENLKPWMPWKNPLTSDGASIRTLQDGTVELVIPRDDNPDGPYRTTLDIPSERQLPAKLQRAQERHEGGMAVVDNPEIWKAETGKPTPREELDEELRKKFISRRVNVATPEGREKAKNVTQADIDSMMPADKYNQALMERQQVAVEREVAKQGRQEQMAEMFMNQLTKNPFYKAAQAVNPNRKKKEEMSGPKIPYYRQGDSREALKEKESRAIQEWTANESR